MSHLVRYAALALLLAGCASSQATTQSRELPETLRVGLIPNVAPEDQRARYEPFGDYLAQQLGVEVELFVASDYAGVVNALASDQVDIAYLGGLTYVQAEQQVELEPLVTEIDPETGSREYLSAIVVGADSEFETIDDLVAGGASVAFGDVSSTSGSLYPRIMLVEAGVECGPRDLTVCPPLSEVSFSGGHDATARAVLAGTVDAGGLELRILRRLERDGEIPPDALRVIAERDVMGYPWVARAALGPDVHEEIAQAFISIDDPELLDLLRGTGYERVSPGDYAEVREQAEELGLLTMQRDER